MPPGTAKGEGHSDIIIPPITAAHMGVSNVNDAVVTDESLAAAIPNKSVGSAVEITPKAINNTILSLDNFMAKVGLFK